MIQKVLSLLFISALLASCLPGSGEEGSQGFHLPPLEIPLRDFATSQPVIVNSPVPTITSRPAATDTPSVPQPPTQTPTITPLPYPLWIDPSVPETLRETALELNLQVAANESAASLRLGLADTSDANPSTWIYALVAPFPRLRDGVVMDELETAWNASSFGPAPEAPLWMTESTLSALTAILGEARPGAVHTVAENALVDALWENQSAWGIVPFERLDPRLKVLSVNGQSPVRNDFDESAYPLKIQFALAGDNATSFDLPATNRDPSKLTVLMMTGVTALVRATATRMMLKGVDYPAWDIGDTLKAADITHISNEVPFYTGCPYPDPRQEGLVFCSTPQNIGLLDMIGTDVVELTGNHFQDYGSVATLQTLEMYNERGWPYFGGGANLEDAKKPAVLIHNGNRFAFIGCNPVGPGFAWATEDQPGAAPCEDYEWIKNEIADLSAQGYIVIATFQYVEYYVPEPTAEHIRDFRAIADAGATIVSGSQAHVPQAIEFYDGAFIHYGLGNLFFDQMGGPSEREFLDRHVFYDGRYISTELLTARLEDYARPRLMRTDERNDLLTDIFNASGWPLVQPEE